MLLIIDNYDSFTYNLVQYFRILGEEVVTYTNDGISIQGITALKPDYLVISPGPNTPKEAGVSLEVIEHFYQTIPILGVCLGHQCIAHYFGANIIPAPSIIHGKTSLIHHRGEGLFQEIPSPFLATRYHSLMIQQSTLPSFFQIDAWSDDLIMGISHRAYPLYGVQFHPEAILTEYGFQLLSQFLEQGKKTSNYSLRSKERSDFN